MKLYYILILFIMPLAACSTMGELMYIANKPTTVIQTPIPTTHESVVSVNNAVLALTPKITSSPTSILLESTTAPTNNINQPRLIIYDTDWWGDIDDVVAARVLIWAEREGMIDLVALISSIAKDLIPPSMDGFFHADGRAGLVIGVDLKATEYSEVATYQYSLAELSHTYNDLTDVEDAVSVYRRAYANQKKPIDIVVVGHLNAVSEFLKSKPDEISDLTGLELIKANGGVLWCMGGTWPEGNEYNFSFNPKSRLAAAYVCDIWPNDIIFLGFEVGETVITGGTLNDITSIEDDILLKALTDHGHGDGRSSWDPMTALLASHGDMSIAGYTSVTGKAVVNPENGQNEFIVDENGNHKYVVKIHTDAWYEHEIDSIIERNAWRSRPIGENSLDKK